MEMVKGVKKSECLELEELLKEEVKGQTVKVSGAVHTIRDMGTVAFVILRRRDGLIQCVYEKGVSGFDLKDVKEAASVEVTGVVSASEKAPHGIEIRLREIRILSEPAAPHASAHCKVENEHFSGGKAELPSHLSSESPGAVQDSVFRRDL